MSSSSVALGVKNVRFEDLYDVMGAGHVSKPTLQTQLQSLMEVRMFEDHPLGFLIVWSKTDDNGDMIGSIMDQYMHTSWKGKTFSDNKGRAAQLFLLDGGTLLNCQNGQVEATTIHFVCRASCPYFLEGHGTKHQSAVNLSFNWNVVVMVRSVNSGDITVLSQSMTRRGFVARVSASQAMCQAPSLPCNEMMSQMKENGIAKESKSISDGRRLRRKRRMQKGLTKPVSTLPSIHIWSIVQLVQGMAILWLCYSVQMLQSQP